VFILIELWVDVIAIVVVVVVSSIFVVKMRLAVLEVVVVELVFEELHNGGKNEGLQKHWATPLITKQGWSFSHGFGLQRNFEEIKFELSICSVVLINVAIDDMVDFVNKLFKLVVGIFDVGVVEAVVDGVVVVVVVEVVVVEVDVMIVSEALFVVVVVFELIKLGDLHNGGKNDGLQKHWATPLITKQGWSFSHGFGLQLNSDDIELELSFLGVVSIKLFMVDVELFVVVVDRVEVVSVAEVDVVEVVEIVDVEVVELLEVVELELVFGELHNGGKNEGLQKHWATPFITKHRCSFSHGFGSQRNSDDISSWFVDVLSILLAVVLKKKVVAVPVDVSEEVLLIVVLLVMIFILFDVVDVVESNVVSVTVVTFDILFVEVVDVFLLKVDEAVEMVFVEVFESELIAFEDLHKGGKNDGLQKHWATPLITKHGLSFSHGFGLQ
jgi:hypothetical protein